MKEAQAEALTARYESLRRAALGKEPPAGHGLALVIHRGVSAWLRAWGELEVAPARPATYFREPCVLQTTNIPELVQGLTSLALGAIRG